MHSTTMKIKNFSFVQLVDYTLHHLCEYWLAVVTTAVEGQATVVSMNDTTLTSVETAVKDTCFPRCI